LELKINYIKIIKFLALIIVLLSIMSILGQVYKFTIGQDLYIKIFEESVELFNLDMENNIPTWYATISLFFCSMILLLIGLVKKNVGDKFYRHWIILSVIFTILSLDENIQLHEKTDSPLTNFFNSSGIFHFAWTIPAIFLLFFLFFFFLKFLKNLPTKTRILFLFSGIIFITGAIGAEFVGGYYIDCVNPLYKESLVYALITNFEEILEMTGILSFIYALLDYMSLHLIDLRIRILNSK
jgi:ABC-type multidrug transport system permease subunit